jgi:type IV pilus secretin PilQ/predicted competence protein
MRHPRSPSLLAAALLCGAVTAFAESDGAAPGPLNGLIDRLIQREGAVEKRGMDTPVTVNIREMDLAQAVRLLAEEAGINIAIGKEVTGTVSCSLNDVTARAALEAFLRANGYEVVPADGVLVVVKEGARKVVLPAVEKPRRVRRTLHLPYTGLETDSVATSSGVGKGGAASTGAGSAVSKQAKPVDETIGEMLSPDGRMAFYARQHLLVVEDYEDVVRGIEEFVEMLWQVPKQVFIDSSLLEISLEDGEDLGLSWDTLTKVSDDGKRNQLTGVTTGRGTAVTSMGPSMGLDRFFSFGLVNANLDIVLEAIRTRRHVDLRSNPRVLVMNHRTASIVVGQEIPYLSSIETTSAEPVRTYAFKEVAVRLDVTPHVSDDGMIFLDVHPTVKSVIGYTDDPRQPILSVREAATNVAVHSGDTLIIGGLVQRSKSEEWAETPFLARIPLLGLLFRQKSTADTKNDLLFMLSPRILDEAVAADVKASHKDLYVELPPHPGETAGAGK